MGKAIQYALDNKLGLDQVTASGAAAAVVRHTGAGRGCW